MSDNETRAGCCGGPAPEEGSCCVRDAEAKAGGESGCGCGSASAPETAAKDVPRPCCA